MGIDPGSLIIPVMFCETSRTMDHIFHDLSHRLDVETCRGGLVQFEKAIRGVGINDDEHILTLCEEAIINGAYCSCELFLNDAAVRMWSRRLDSESLGLSPN